MEGGSGASRRQAPVELRSVVLLSVAHDTAIVMSGARCVELVSDGSFDPARAWALLSDGVEPDRCATLLGCAPEAVASFVDTLRDARLTVSSARCVDALDVDGVVELVRASATMWKRHSLLHRMFRLLEDDEPRAGLLASLLVEVCHYTRGAPDVALEAAARAESPAARRALAEFALEEADHFRDIAAGAARLLGVEPERVADSKPLPGTIALLSTLRMVAQLDVAAYGAVLCFAEARPSTAARAADDFVALGTKNGVSEDVLRPVAAHVREDAVLTHSEIGPSVLRAELPARVDSARIGRIVDATHDVKHAFDLLYDSLVAADASGRDYRLRRAVRWQTLEAA